MRSWTIETVSEDFLPTLAVKWKCRSIDICDKFPKGVVSIRSIS